MLARDISFKYLNFVLGEGRSLHSYWLDQAAGDLKPYIIKHLKIYLSDLFLSSESDKAEAYLDEYLKFKEGENITNPFTN
jgi:hypothetical protein